MESKCETCCQKYGIEKKRSSPYHPEGDGISERPIGVMKSLFRTKIEEEKLPQRKWTDILPDVQLAMNQKTHSSTDVSPFQLMYGNTERLDTRNPLLLNTFNKPTLNKEERAASKQSFINTAKTKLSSTAEKMKHQYDKSATDKPLSVGDLVYIKREQTQKGISKKLSTVYYDLSRVVETNHPIYKIQRVKSGRVGWVHYNRLRLKTMFEDQGVIVNVQPQFPGDPANIHEGADEEPDDEDYEYPMVINNSTLGRVNVPSNQPEEETGNDVETSISLGRNENLAETPPSSVTQQDAVAGREFDEQGRFRSTRVKKSTQAEDFVYFV